MEIDKRTIIGIILILLVLIAVNTPLYRKTFFPQQYEREQQRREALRQAHEDVGSERPREPEQAVEQPVAGPQTENAVTTSFDTVAGEGEIISVETPRYQLQFSTRGGSIVSCKLKEFQDPDSNLVEIIGADGMGNLAIGFAIEGDSIDTAPMVFDVDGKEIVLTENDDSESLTFSLALDEETRIHKTFTFYPNTYSIDLLVGLDNLNTTISNRYYTIAWKSGLSPTEPRLLDDFQEAKVYAFMGANMEKFDIGRTEAKFDATPEGDVHWVGTRTKYFAAAIIPKDHYGKKVDFWGEKTKPGVAYAIWDKYRVEEKDRNWKKYAFNLNMSFLDEKEKRDNFTIYLGPLDYDVVKAEQVGLEGMMSLGWKFIRPFSKMVLWSLKTLHSVIPNYGWVIIIFSIVIKIILYPLTHKSFHSMQKMQQLQPKLTELKEKYSKDPQRLNQETMKMYKEQGVNPMGGCLPMLLQMPLLYALFVTFRNTVALRGESFIFWIKDLANPDTIAVLPFNIPMYGNQLNILPLLMGATMLVQQKMSMKDPKQKMMVYFMPVFFTLLFNSFPSGLNLYYMLFNLFSIIQQKFISDKMKAEQGMTPANTQVKKKSQKR